MKTNLKLIAAVVVNGLIIVFEVLGLILSIDDHGLAMFQFYTQDSNYFALVASVLFEIYAVRKLRGRGDIPGWISTVRYMATCCLTLTFLVVIFVLAPMGNWTYFVPMLTYGSMLYHHLLCPILSIVSLIVFESTCRPPKNRILIATIPTVAYAIIAIILNLTGTLHGPYPFLYVYEQPVWLSIVWLFVILGMALLIAWLLWLCMAKARSAKGSSNE